MKAWPWHRVLVVGILVLALFAGDRILAPFRIAAETPGGDTGTSSQWERDLRLTSDPGDSRLSFNFAWSVAADDSGSVHVVWYNDRDGNAEIYYKRKVKLGRPPR